jgi:hypothetical protein
MKTYLAMAMGPAVLLGVLTMNAFGADAKTHDGKFVSVAAEKFMMTDMEGKNEHSHTLTADAKVTLDGKAVKVSELKKGTKIRVTTKEGDLKIATRIEAIDKNPDFEKVKPAT